MKRKFFRFLKNNNAFDLYCANARNPNCQGRYRGLDIFKQEHPKEWINFAFTYAKTPQGQDFWFGLSMKWKHGLITNRI